MVLPHSYIADGAFEHHPPTRSSAFRKRRRRDRVETVRICPGQHVFLFSQAGIYVMIS